MENYEQNFDTKMSTSLVGIAMWDWTDIYVFIVECYHPAWYRSAEDWDSSIPDKRLHYLWSAQLLRQAISAESSAGSGESTR